MNRSGPMVVACLAPTDLRPEVDPLSAAVHADPRRADLPAAEAAALEHALRIAEAWDGWVLAVCGAPVEAEPLLRDLLALGAEVVRIDPAPHDHPATGPRPVPPAELTGDPAGWAAVLATVVTEAGRPALVICGDRSAGTGIGAVPALLAAALGVDQALGLVSVMIEGDGRLRVERRLDGGWRETLRVDGPAVLSVEGAGVRLRRAGLNEALAAEQSDVPVVGRFVRTGVDGDLRVGPPRPYRPRPRPVPAPTGDAHARLLALTGALSSREPARLVGPVSPVQAADELLGYLQRHGYRGG